MEENKLFINELIGKKVLIKTRGGEGVKDVTITPGGYKGNMLGFDGSLIKLEYNVVKFESGAEVITKSIIFINLAYIITVQEVESN